MNAAVRKIGALAQKDAVDLAKNPSMAVCMLMPVGFAVLFRFLAGSVTERIAAESASAALADRAAGVVSSFLLSSAFCMSIGMIVGMVIVYGIAEEKEKHTLRTLMLANVSAGQVAVARALVTLAATLAVAAACYLVLGVSGPELLLPGLALCALGAVPFLLLSLVLGLAARDQMTAGMYSVPVVLLALAPMFGMYSEAAARVTALLPTGAMDTLVRLMMEGRLFTSDSLAPLAVIAAWTVAGAVVFKLLFQRLAQDN